MIKLTCLKGCCHEVSYWPKRYRRRHFPATPCAGILLIKGRGWKVLKRHTGARLLRPRSWAFPRTGGRGGCLPCLSCRNGYSCSPCPEGGDAQGEQRDVLVGIVEGLFQFFDEDRFLQDHVVGKCQHEIGLRGRGSRTCRLHRAPCCSSRSPKNLADGHFRFVLLDEALVLPEMVGRYEL